MRHMDRLKLRIQEHEIRSGISRYKEERIDHLTEARKLKEKYIRGMLKNTLKDIQKEIKYEETNLKKLYADLFSKKSTSDRIETHPLYDKYIYSYERLAELDDIYTTLDTLSQTDIKELSRKRFDEIEAFLNVD